MIAMNVYINVSPAILTRVNIDEARFAPLCDADKISLEDAVAVVIKDADFAENLAMACSLKIPVLALAGSMSAFGQNAYTKAIAAGVKEEAIIYKDGSSLCNHAGRQFASLVNNGVGVAAVLELSRYALQHNLVPEIIILWNPDDEDKRVDEAAPIITLLEKASETRNRNDPRPFGQIGLNDLLDNAGKIILAIRTVPVAGGSKMASILADKLGALHLEIASQAFLSPTHHPNHPQNAVRQAHYAYSNGVSVCLESPAPINGPVVVEIEPNELPPGLLDRLHDKADFVIHVSDAFDDCRVLLEEWIEAGGRLDAIIPNNNDDSELYEKQYPGLVSDIERFANKLINR